jgi:hypothetical protein
MEIDFGCHPNSCGQDISLGYRAGKYLDLGSGRPFFRLKCPSTQSVDFLSVFKGKKLGVKVA